MTARTRKYGVTIRRTAPLRLGVHSDAPAKQSWHAWVSESKQPIAVDLFCGAGGLSHGLETAGYRVVLAVDSDEWALESHAHNLAGLVLCRDLAVDESRDEIVSLFDGLDVDLIAGGPPCQPFSRAGRSKIRSLVDLGVRDDVDDREELWRPFLDVVERISPRAVLMENVPDMAFADDMIVLRSMIDRLERAGYEVDARIVDAWRHGVPQHRQRLILVGMRDGALFEWPDPVELVTVRDAIGDLPVLNVTPDTPIGKAVMDYDTPDMGDFARKARKECVNDDARIIHDHVTRPVRKDDHEAFELMAFDTLYSELPNDLKRYRDDIFDDKYNRLAWSNLSRSITAHLAKDGYWYIHPEQHRTLTVREAARIQTFPDTFRFAGSRSHQFQQIGNAVPPALGEVIGKAVIDCVRQEGGHRWRRRTKRALYRKRLAEWATKDSQNAPWAYPGEPWPVAVGLIAGSKGATDWPTPDDVLGLVPTFEGVNPEVLAKIEAKTGSTRRQSVVKRIATMAADVRKNSDGWKSDGWRRTGLLGPAKRGWYALMTGESDGLVTSSAVLRVTARVTGTDVDRRNRNSIGRMELAKLVGAGDAAATLNVAMHRLGTAICTSREPKCRECPVREVCQGSIA